MTYFDLSVLINPQTPVYPGDRMTEVEQRNAVAHSGFSSHHFSLGTHVGTHLDAPSHVINGGQSLDEVAPDQFIGHGVLVDASNGDFSSVMQANIQTGDIVLFHTGQGNKLGQDDYFNNIPVMSEDVANYLVSARVKMIGVDTYSVDRDPTLPIHNILLSSNILIIENLINLDQLQGKQFEVIALPIKLQAEAAPARVVARIL